jgi:conjugative transfer region protein TrbK
MSLYLTARQFAGIVATGFIVLVVTLAATRSQRGDDAGIIAAPEHEEPDALASEVVAGCRTVTSDQTAALEICRRVWAENRRQFFRPAKKPPVPAGPVPTAASATGKNRDRVSPVEAEH